MVGSLYFRNASALSNFILKVKFSDQHINSTNWLNYALSFQFIIFLQNLFTGLIISYNVKCYNEIALCAMKSERCSDEICFADEIKSVPSPNEVGFHHKVISFTEGGFIPVRISWRCQLRTDLVEKSQVIDLAFFCERVTKRSRTG